MHGAAALEIYSDSEALMRAAAERVVAHAAAAVEERGRFAIALSGGSTPRRLYELLATPAIAARIDWPRVHVYWGDERCVPPAHPASNFRMADEALLAHVPLPAGNVHRIAGEDEPDAAAPNDATKGEGKKQLMARAKSYQEAREVAERKNDSFDFAKMALQLAVVLGSVSILAVSRPLLWAAGLLGVVGALLTLNGFLLLVALP